MEQDQETGSRSEQAVGDSLGSLRNPGFSFPWGAQLFSQPVPLFLFSLAVHITAAGVVQRAPTQESDAPALLNQHAQPRGLVLSDKDAECLPSRR